jgi:hypothetical protein
LDTCDRYQHDKAGEKPSWGTHLIQRTKTVNSRNYWQKGPIMAENGFKVAESG